MYTNTNGRSFSGICSELPGAVDQTSTFEGQHFSNIEFYWPPDTSKRENVEIVLDALSDGT